MTSRDFCYWLQGYFEITGEETQQFSMTAEQGMMVKRHLALVFKHEIDPSQGTPEHQALLQKIHDQDKPKPPANPFQPDPFGQLPGLTGIDSNTMIRC